MKNRRRKKKRKIFYFFLPHVWVCCFKIFTGEIFKYRCCDEEDEEYSGDKGDGFSWLKEMGLQDKIRKPDGISIQLYLYPIPLYALRKHKYNLFKDPWLVFSGRRRLRPRLWTTNQNLWCVWRERTLSTSSTSSSAVRAWWLLRGLRLGYRQRCWPPRLSEGLPWTHWRYKCSQTQYIQHRQLKVHNIHRLHNTFKTSTTQSVDQNRMHFTIMKNIPQNNFHFIWNKITVNVIQFSFPF